MTQWFYLGVENLGYRLAEWGRRHREDARELIVQIEREYLR